MSPLTGIGVLVTRPQAQAERLTTLLVADGATVFHLPTLEFRARADLAAQRAALGPVDRYDWIVFVSANAVEYGATLLGPTHAGSLVAIGPATAAALRARGYEVALEPERGYTSEELLASERMQAVAGERILIVRGGTGRDVLAQQLSARGAHVAQADVYERLRATPPPGAVAAVESAWSRGQITVLTATSAEVLRGLIELLGPVGRELAHRTTLLVGGERILGEARRMGFTGEAVLAQSPESGDLVAALRRWRERQPGAPAPSDPSRRR